MKNIPYDASKDHQKSTSKRKTTVKKTQTKSKYPKKRDFGQPHYIINVFYENDKLSDEFFQNEYCDQSLTQEEKRTSAMLKTREMVRGKGGLGEPLLLPRIYNDYYDPVSSSVRGTINRLSSLEEEFKQNFKGKYTYDKFMKSDMYTKELDNFLNIENNKKMTPEKIEVFDRFLSNGCSLNDVHTFFSYVKNLAVRSIGGRENTYVG